MADVAVIGSGMAGLLSAIRLHDSGHNVIIYEKMPFPGGISITAGGGVKTSINADASFKYLKTTCAGTTPDNILKKFAETMVKILPWFRELAESVGSTIKVESNQFLNMPLQHYGFEGHDAHELACIIDVKDKNYAVQFPNVKAGTKDGFWGSVGGDYGINLYATIYKNVLQRQIPIRFNNAIKKLNELYNKEPFHDVVVLACGGFENNTDMKTQYFQGKPVLHNGFEGNTGDGIKMAQKAGADLWHMWHYHGTYGFEVAPGTGARIKGANIWSPTEKDANSSRPLRHIVVDANGRRFMNEYPPYITDTGHRPLELFNAEEIRYNRIPAYFISDETGRKIGPWASIRSNGIDISWSDDNVQEIESGILTKCETVDEIANFIGCDYAVINATLKNWNNIVIGKQKCQWHRPNKINESINNPPYYVGKVWPIVGNTQGGPKSNEYRQVVDPYGEPINGLYTAGQCGSIFGHLYMSAGNFAECFVSALLIDEHVNETYTQHGKFNQSHIVRWKSGETIWEK
jgi:succinate dehydrogenase/fumarate reductase flavoprotein subunit